MFWGRKYFDVPQNIENERSFWVTRPFVSMKTCVRFLNDKKSRNLMR